jgi:hypothetical protein
MRRRLCKRSCQQYMNAHGWVVPACCTGGSHCNSSIIIIPVVCKLQHQAKSSNPCPAALVFPSSKSSSWQGLCPVSNACLCSSFRCSHWPLSLSGTATLLARSAEQVVRHFLATAPSRPAVSAATSSTVLLSAYSTLC